MSDIKRGLVIWLTGLPCSGKTTLAREIEKYFLMHNLVIQCLDGDVVRATINKDLGFSKKDRLKNIERVANIAQKISDSGEHVFLAFVSPYQEMRDSVRAVCKNFLEVYVKCDVKTCKKRDIKGMYLRAENSEIMDFTGVQGVFEIPQNPEIVVDTKNETIRESTKKIIQYIENKYTLTVFFVSQMIFAETWLMI